jgi:MFS family permease
VTSEATSPTRVVPDVAAVQRRSIGVLSAGAVLAGLGIAGSVPAGSLLAASLADSEAVAGLAQTAGVVGAAVIALPLARATLTGGRRRALTLGYGVGAIGAAVVVVAAAARVLPAVLLGCLLVGMASAAGYQARYAATDLAEEHHRARAMSWVVWAATIGAVVGPNLLGLSGGLGLRLGLPQLAGPYVVAGLALGLAALGLWLVLRPDPYLLSRRVAAAGGQPAAAPRLRDGLEHLRGRPRAILGVSAVAVGHVAMVMVMVMTPVHMGHHDVTLQVIGLVISVHIAGMYALSPVVGWLVDRAGRLAVIGLGISILLAAATVSALAAPDDALVLGIGLFLLGLGWSCTLIAGSTLLIDDVPVPERPAVQGLSDLVMNVAGALGGIVAGIVVAFSSYGVLCAVSAVPVLLLTVPLAGQVRAARRARG